MDILLAFAAGGAIEVRDDVVSESSQEPNPLGDNRSVSWVFYSARNILAGQRWWGASPSDVLTRSHQSRGSSGDLANSGLEQDRHSPWCNHHRATTSRVRPLTYLSTPASLNIGLFFSLCGFSYISRYNTDLKTGFGQHDRYPGVTRFITME